METNDIIRRGRNAPPLPLSHIPANRDQTPVGDKSQGRNKRDKKKKTEGHPSSYLSLAREVEKIEMISHDGSPSWTAGNSGNENGKLERRNSKGAGNPQGGLLSPSNAPSS